MMKFLSLCWFYIGPMLFIMLPFVAGMMFHHFRWRRVSKALDWLLFVFILLILVLIWVLTQALVYVLYSPSTALLSICAWIMLCQTVFWCISWLKNRGKGELKGWLAVSLPAFILSLIITSLTFSVYFKKKDLQSIDILKHQQQSRIQSNHLKAVGYLPYPNADYPFDHSLIVGTSETEYYLVVHMKTDDNPDEILSFYSQCVANKGFDVHRTSNQNKNTAKLIAHNNNHIFEIEEWFDDIWVITVRWNISEDIMDNLDTIYDLSVNDT